MNDQEFVRTERIKLNVDGLRDQLCDWLRANGIDPKNVPYDARMSWVDGQLTTDMHLLDENGRKQFDPTSWPGRPGRFRSANRRPWLPPGCCHAARPAADERGWRHDRAGGVAASAAAWRGCAASTGMR
jgi:hypothetical protein